MVVVAKPRGILPNQVPKKQSRKSPRTRWSGTTLLITEKTAGSIEFFIPAIFPGMNGIIDLSKKGRGIHNAYAREKQKIENELSILLLPKELPMFKSCNIGFHWVEPNRRRDKDNISASKKFLLDAFVKVGLITDDSWGCIKGFLPERFSVDQKRFGVWVRLEGVGQ